MGVTLQPGKRAAQVRSKFIKDLIEFRQISSQLSGYLALLFRILIVSPFPPLAIITMNFSVMLRRTFHKIRI